MKRIYNFNAGPAMLPLEVLQEVQSRAAGSAGQRYVDFGNEPPRADL